MTMPVVPAEPVELTPDLLSEALREAFSSPATRVAGVDWERIGQDRGFTGLVARLHLRYDPPGSGPPTVVAKFPLAEAGMSAYREAQRRRPEANRQFHERMRREPWFYETIAQRAGLAVPACWATGSDPEAGRLCLLLEDIPSGHPGDALHGCSPDELAFVLKALAPVHALGEAGLDGLTVWAGNREARPAWQERIRQAWHTLHERNELDGLPPRVLELGDRLCDSLLGILDRLDGTPRTLMHADLHLDNVLFDPADAGRPAVILDWQSVCFGPAVLDLAPLLATSLSIEDRRRHETRLLREYHQALRESGAPEPDPGEFRETYALALLVRFAGTIGGLARTDPATLHGREAELHNAGLGDGRLVAALLDHNTDTLI